MFIDKYRVFGQGISHGYKGFVHRLCTVVQRLLTLPRIYKKTRILYNSESVKMQRNICISTFQNINAERHRFCPFGKFANQYSMMINFFTSYFRGCYFSRSTFGVKEHEETTDCKMAYDGFYDDSQFGA
ncbi:hypothetical protein CEXT_360681 [Caerostris extrusa]|uniref:Uncharacterized protein n=1 Tax=Caerostris extrusa TaxID=172846 RepID=A0AAV4XG87_CAEEX|nr:hypothetical protein CEXT_360681 [Caerostris extrusa]